MPLWPTAWPRVKRHPVPLGCGFVFTVGHSGITRLCVIAGDELRKDGLPRDSGHVRWLQRPKNTGSESWNPANQNCRANHQPNQEP